ncbi:hypothetical protein DFH07DRAFT_808727 [Mycena maculata]|uniref:Uncharacterized protein n=1 Tax=Mycena maculata TaxID=230809 RepID=A0AAD7JMX0_9AGAR|nr:hypothetical protein DFH07DRAFT_808727 [Mycena maculata]
MTIQTRRQAKLAAELQAAAQAVVQPAPLASNSLQAASTFGSFSSLSTLTPTSSFVSDAGTVGKNGGNLSTIAETDTEEDDEFSEQDVPDAPPQFGAPQFATRHGPRPMITPAQSQSDRFPAAVFETPKKNTRLPPSEREVRAAQWIRDSELASSKGMAQLTRNGTLLVLQDSSPDYVPRAESGLGSPFTSPASSAAPSLTRSRTRGINPNTGEFLD